MNENSPGRLGGGDKNADRQTVTVEIAGERHVLRSDASIEYTQSVAAHLDSTIRALGANLDPHRAAILAALTITDELFRTRTELVPTRRTEAAALRNRSAARRTLHDREDRGGREVRRGECA